VPAGKPLFCKNCLTADEYGLFFAYSAMGYEGGILGGLVFLKFISIRLCRYYILADHETQ
jgi:hypothetical protein